eukprot:g30450.t1
MMLQDRQLRPRDRNDGQLLPFTSKLLKHRAGNGLWHIDSSFKVLPGLASVMSGPVVVPAGAGGETEFASTRAALEAFDGKEELENLICVHDFAYSLGLSSAVQTRSARLAPDVSSSSRLRKQLPPARHFLLRETAKGRSFFTGKHCSHIEGVELQEGRALIRQINQHITKPEFVYRHRWSSGDLLRRLHLEPGAVAKAAPILPADALAMLESVVPQLMVEEQARKAYEDILKEKLQPSAQTFGALVNAAVRVGDLQEARRWLKASASFGVNPGVVAYTTLLKGLCEAGEMDQAREALQEMLENKCQPNIRTANTLLRGYRRAGEVDASVELLQQMENDWGVAPDATSSEYLVALLCQGFRVAAARRLLKRIKLSEGAPDGEAFGTWEGGRAAALRSRASLWTMLAESSLLTGDLPQAKKSLKHARVLRRQASKLHRQEPLEEGKEGNSSTALFIQFKERELARRAKLIAAQIEGGQTAVSKVSLLKHMARLLALPHASQFQVAPGEAPVQISAEELRNELQRSFGVAELCAGRPKAQRRFLQRLHAVVKDGGGQWQLAAAFDADLPLKVELCSGEGEWVCAQATADRDQANWVCVEHRRDRVFRTFSRSCLAQVSNLCLVAGDAALLLRLLSPRSVDHMFVNFPEPPVRRGTSGEGRWVTYLRELALSLSGLGFENVDVSHSGPVLCGQDKLGSSIHVWRGKPGRSAGVVDPEASSYFDRLWSHGRFTKRYFILVKKEKNQTLESGLDAATSRLLMKKTWCHGQIIAAFQGVLYGLWGFGDAALSKPCRMLLMSSLILLPTWSGMSWWAMHGRRACHAWIILGFGLALLPFYGIVLGIALEDGSNPYQLALVILTSLQCIETAGYLLVVACLKDRAMGPGAAGLLLWSLLTSGLSQSCDESPEVGLLQQSRGLSPLDLARAKKVEFSDAELDNVLKIISEKAHEVLQRMHEQNQHPTRGAFLHPDAKSKGVPANLLAIAQSEKKCYDAAMAFTHSVSDHDKKDLSADVARRSAACQTPTRAPKEKPELTGTDQAGAKIFATSCEECHSGGVEALQTFEENVDLIVHGKGSMPGFEKTLTKDEVAEVAHYVVEQSEAGW